MEWSLTFTHFSTFLLSTELHCVGPPAWSSRGGLVQLSQMGIWISAVDVLERTTRPIDVTDVLVDSEPYDSMRWLLQCGVSLQAGCLKG